ncbi:type II toxin-antitoxin system VapC family toxin [Micropruina sp.]|uniref:type II toxin-antitoxin system VapC family toxin n=1 Tax=Micropruina sp. TaxID=2737536 RepID=UPI0039E45165
MTPTRGLADTSVFVAMESGRRLHQDRLPDELRVSVITLAELEAGVLAAQTLADRSTRLATLERVAAVEPLPVDIVATAAWARLRVEVHQAGRRVNVNDLWIAAVAIANDLPVVSQDDDFAVLAELGLLTVINV